MDSTKSYSRGDYSSLPSDDLDLETSFVCSEYPDVSTQDNIYIEQTATDTPEPYAIFLWKNQHNNNTDIITSNCVLKTSRAPSVNPVYLQIYNCDTGSWETLDSNNSANADTEFTLSGIQSTNLSSYYDGNYFVAHRIYQKVE